MKPITAHLRSALLHACASALLASASYPVAAGAQDTPADPPDSQEPAPSGDEAPQDAQPNAEAPEAQRAGGDDAAEGTGDAEPAATATDATTEQAPAAAAARSGPAARADAPGAARLDRPWDVHGEITAFGAYTRNPMHGHYAVPIGADVTLEAHPARRDLGISARLGFEGAAPHDMAEFEMHALEYYHRGIGGRLDVRAGRLNLVHGGRFRFVDGASFDVRFGKGMHLGAWGGMAWHPESIEPLLAGPTAGAELAFARLGVPLSAHLRYEFFTSAARLAYHRIGGDVNISAPRAAGLLAQARVDFEARTRTLETFAFVGNLQPHYRARVRVEAGLSNPVAPELAAGDSIYTAFHTGPTAYAEGRLRLALPPGYLTIDGGFTGAIDQSAFHPGGRVGVRLESHPAQKGRHALRVQALHSYAGTAATALAEVGRTLGPVDLEALAEQTFYRYSGRTWRAVTHLAGQLAMQPTQAFRLSLTGELNLGRYAAPEGLVMLWTTLHWHTDGSHGLCMPMDRPLSPWSPYRWSRTDMPRSPGTLPGAPAYAPGLSREEPGGES